jgi:putative ABC transport system permease protein
MLDTAFQRAGKNLVQTWPGKISEDFSPAFDRRWLWYTPADVAVLRARVRESDLVGAEARTHAPAAFRGRALSLEVRGVEPESQAIRDVPLASGRLISREDVEHRRRVLVVGHRTRERLLGAEGRVGSWVRLDGTPFQVVGVLDRVGTQLSRDGAEIDDQLWIPLSVHLALWPNPWLDEQMLSTIFTRAKDRKRIAEAKGELRRVLAERLGVPPDDEEAVPIFSPIEMLDRLPLEQQNGLYLLIALTTLLVGGIGILAMMLDSVQERRAEIGVRLALGARRRDVLLQFLWEGIAIGVVGGGLGVALGTGGALFLASDAFRGGISQAQRDLVPVPELSGAVVLLAVVAMGGVAIVAGLVPAWRAARIDPAETLRVE